MRSLILLTIFVFASSFSIGQEETETTLLLNTPVEGRIDSADTADVWTFYAFKDDVLTFSVEAADFDPVLAIQGANGVIISNDDVDYPNNDDALLEAISIPRTGDYEVVVSSFDDTTGDYVLTMLPGYADLALDERFVSIGEWQNDASVETILEEGELIASMAGVSERASIWNPLYPSFDDFYALLEVELAYGNMGWAVGFALDDYVILVNSQGFWRVTLVTEAEEIVLRDWTPHPAIVAGEEQFSLSIMRHGQGLEVFYDRKLLGQINEVGIATAEELRLVVETANAVGSEITVSFDSLLVTVPRLIDGETVFPLKIVASDAFVISEELERRHVIPSGGVMAWQIDESFAGTYLPGVSRVPLVSAAVYDNLVMGTTFVLSPVDAIVGCGLLLQNIDETNFTIAYLDNTGAYGISQRRGEAFLEGLFGELHDIDAANPNHLLVILYGGILHYYINGNYVGSMNIESVTGEVGNVVVNFDPVDSSCQFSNTWLWTWETE